ncbi:LysM peptidoglycan-binding domain-containing protein [Pseudoalteromonas sp. MMG024]|uniref:LysM peptidoglycan-binding domain-containing protein n=1 Tax=Pseudoalteromonas sp. MMG024 TaxID=2909980 RepID=UPI001F34DDD5|nr:LysM peptidoglycan-binding domain-containing protein [Pseudoalteromonas sp. MMG024]MCF6459124.1 LysM peptidoglycan-binding domain-containing protein [Pseudoalteromonas sp. MMG024]
MNTELIYTIQPGDTLTKIANAISACAGVTPEHIEQANTLTDPNNLQIGQLIAIPFVLGVGDLSYTILSGDTYSNICSRLAQSTELSVADIIVANKGIEPNNLQIGQLLTIPSTECDQSSSLSPSADVMGYWHWTYSQAANPGNATISLAFSGYVNVNEVLSNAQKIESSLTGGKYVCFGGGNQAGAFNIQALVGIYEAIQSNLLQGYDGIAFDIETGDSGLTQDFQKVFAKAKKAGLDVLVTVSHSAPYGISDGNEMMGTFFADSNIDIISPQLYTTGEEPQNDYATSLGVQWSEFANCKAKVVPSLVKDAYYPSAVNYFANQGVTLAGYIQWQQTNAQ